MTNASLLTAAYEQAQTSLGFNGLPIGSVLADKRGRIVARGHNRRYMDQDVTAHAEMVCLRNAGIRTDLDQCTLVSTLSPCIMCTGTTLLFQIPRIIVGENVTFMGAEHLFKKAGVELIVVQDERCIAMMADLVQNHPDKWWGDIGIPEQLWSVEDSRWKATMKRRGYAKYLR